MPRFKPRGSLERNAVEDLWKHTLSRIPTVYGRLTYLASLRDPNSGTYRHHGLIQAFGRDQSVQALRSSHEEAFHEWISMPLPEKNEDLMRYVASLDDPRGVVVDYWLQSRSHGSLPPSSAVPLEREIFSHDLEMLLETLRADEPAVGPRQDSSLHT
jgi:hypothetical protein